MKSIIYKSEDQATGYKNELNPRRERRRRFSNNNTTVEWRRYL